jgi:hypothetical protein
MNDLNRLKYLSGLTESFDAASDPEVIGHVDREPHSLAKEFNKISKYAAELEQMMHQIPEHADLPHWIQSKVVRANDYISTVKHYLEYEIDHEQVHDHPDHVSDDASRYDDPSGV